MWQTGYPPYMAFLERAPDFFDFHAPAAQKIFDMISAHTGVDISGMTEKQFSKFYDEINAAMYGHIANGDTEALRAKYGDAFVDFDAYVKELSAVFHGFVDSNRKHDAAGTEAQAKTTPQEITAKTEQAAQENPRGSNLVITEKSKFPTTPKTRFKANVEAIQVLRTLMQENRYATQAEQEILAKYTGWGGLSNAFDGKNGFDAEARQLQALLDDAEYKAARASILDAYYTAPGIINAMYTGLEKLGFAGGRMLEPSAGVGRFIGAMPQALSGKVKSWTAVELDKVTGSIAKYLYPNADVRVMGFESAKIPDSYMDAVVGNVPFGNISVADKRYPAAVTRSIHNYFIAKALDKVRPGGILCVITSSGTLEAEQPGAREYFMKQADLIGAIRLPNTAFEGTGTNVVSDILVFKKREPGTPYKGEAFATISYRPWEDANHWGNYEINEYFVNHPEMVLGTPDYATGQYGRSANAKKPPTHCVGGSYQSSCLFFVAFGGIEAVEMLLAGGANEVAGVAGLVEADGLAAVRADSLVEAVAVLIAVVAVAVALELVVLIFVLVAEVFLNLAEVFVQLFDIVVERGDIAAEVGEIVRHFVERLDDSLEQLALRLGFVKGETLHQALQIRGLFGNRHNCILQYAVFIRSKPTL